MRPRLRPVVRRLALAALAPLALACSDPLAGTTSAQDDHEPEGVVGTTSEALSATDPVSAAVAGSCTTTSVKGLATQLVAEIQCLRPGTLAPIDKTPGLALGAAVFPYLQAPAATALGAAQKARGTTMAINSALRALPQQYLLYRWYQTGRCGISLAAKPGTSNHESALAVDIGDNAGWRAAMAGKSFRWLGASNPVHYDYTGAGAVNLRGLSVKAFQRLWNRNHPADLIAEDGSYGPATETRLAKSPVGGFAKGAECNKPDAGAPEAGAKEAGAPKDGGPATPGAPSPTDVDLPPYTPEPVPDAPEPTEGASPEAPPLSMNADASTGCSVTARSSSGGVAFSALLVAMVAIGRRRRSRG